MLVTLRQSLRNELSPNFFESTILLRMDSFLKTTQEQLQMLRVWKRFREELTPSFIFLYQRDSLHRWKKLNMTVRIVEPFTIIRRSKTENMEFIRLKHFQMTVTVLRVGLIILSQQLTLRNLNRDFETTLQTKMLSLISIVIMDFYVTLI
jgi:hypothetical protein